MKINFLQIKRPLRAALLVLLLCVVAMTKAQTENITFADANVKAICVANWDADGDGELNTTEAAAVTSLDGVFMFDDGITSFDELQFFTGLTSFGDDEFNSCTSLASITIPNAVTSIGNSAFSDCSSLTSMTSYACTPPTLGNEVFYNVPSVLVLNVPCHTAALYQAADGWSDFANYEEFEYGLCPIIFADDNVKAICVAHWDTNEDGELSYAEVAAVTNLGTYFKSTSITSFDELEYFTSLTSLPNTAFYGCTSLASIALPASVSALGNGSFYNCTNLATMTVYAETPPSVGTNAFKNVPNNMVVQVLCEAYDAYHNSDGWSGFANIQGFGPMCPITFADANVKALCVANWDANGDGELSYDEAAAVTDLGEVFKSNSTITSFVELQYFTGLTSIGYKAFEECENLAFVSIPNSVTSIESFAFYDCSGLASIFIPNSVTYMGSMPFHSCNGLGQIIVDSGNLVYDSRDNCNAIIKTSTNELVIGCKNTFIPNSVTSIGENAFLYCTSLTSINIPNSVTSIGYSAFSNCSSLIELNIGNSVTSFGMYAFAHCTSLTTIEIPNSVTSTGDWVFYGCSGLTSIEIPNSVTSIGNAVFYDCSGLVSIIIPNSVTSIGGPGEYNPFGGCSSLEQIIVESGNTVYDSRDNCNAIIKTGTNKLITGCKNTVIPNSVTSIHTLAFDGCSGLMLIEIPNSVRYIGDRVFEGCSGLTSITIPNSVISIGYNPFSGPSGGCSSLEQIIVDYGNTVYDSRENCNAIIKSSTNELVAGCKNTTIPNTVTSINRGAFYHCIGLTSIEIPNSVTSIGESAFFGCSGLTSMTVLADNPPALSNTYGINMVYTYMFYYVDKTIPVYVPCASISAYQNAIGWNEFANYMPATVCDSGQIAVMAYPTEGGIVTGAGYYEGGTICTLTATANPGYAFINWTKEGVEVSNSETYSFFVSGDALFVANFEQGVVVIGSGTATNEFLPSHSYYKYSLSQQIYTANEIGNAGTISSIAFYNTGETKTRSYDIYMVSTEKTVFESRVDLIAVSESDLVFSGEVTLSANSWTDLQFNTPFQYDGVSNIVLVMDDNSGNWTPSPHMACRVFDTNGHQAIQVCNDNTNYNPFNPSISSDTYCYSMVKNQIKLSIEHEQNIIFADANVKALCVANWDTNGDGELSYAEASVVTDLDEVFEHKSSITSFDELQYFINLTTIGSYAFYYCSSLTSIVIPNSVTLIGDHAFAYCSGLTSLEIPNSVTLIGNYAFLLCTGLTSIEIPNSVISLSDCAFSTCTGLTSIEIPSSVISIGINPFRRCSGLEQIIVDSGNTVYDNRENCNAIIKTSTNELVTGCKNTVIPNSVIMIGEAFLGCTGLTSIVIPNSVTTIGGNAFLECTGLSSIIVLAETSPALGGYVFYDVPTNIPVYVPCNAVENYQIASGWNSFSNIIGLCSGDVVVTVNPIEGGMVTGNGYYNGGEVCVLTATPNPGYDFVSWIEEGRVISTDSVLTFYAHPTNIVANFIAMPPLPVIAEYHPDPNEPNSPYVNVHWAASSFDAMIGDEASSAYTAYMPIYTLYDNSISEALYTASELSEAGVTAGPITSLSWEAIEVTTIQPQNNISIWMANVPDTELTTTSHLANNMTLVYTGNIGIPPLGWNEFVFNESNFVWDGTSNILILCQRNNGQWNGRVSWRSHNPGFYGMAYKYQDGTPYDVTSQIYTLYLSNTVRPNIIMKGEGSMTYNLYRANCDGTDAQLIAENLNDTQYIDETWWQLENNSYKYGVSVADSTNTDIFWSNCIEKQGDVVVQTCALSQGWNWISTYIDMENNDGLSQLTGCLGTNGLQIITTGGSLIYRGGSWIGSITSLSNTKAYKIKTNAPVTVTITGSQAADPANCEIQIMNGWNWIAYPLSENKTVAEALAGFEPSNGDNIKTQGGSAVYRNGNWLPNTFTFEPGKGYTYKSMATQPKTLIFQTGSKKQVD